MDGNNSKIIMSAFTDEQASQLTGLSKAQLAYWDRQDFFKPSFGYENRRSPYSRIYSFHDLISLKTLNTLRNETRVPLQHLRKVKEKLLHLGDDLWAKTTLYVLERKVVFKNHETEGLEEVVSKQGILEIPLYVVSGNMKTAVSKFSKRDESTIGKINKKRGFAHNQDVIAGTRIRVGSIKSFHDAGYSTVQILKEYPTLAAKDVEVAINHKAA